jgi:hypothetical protein
MAIPGYKDVILATPHPLLGYWRLGDSGSVAADSDNGNHPLTLAGGVTTGVSGALAGDPDKAMHFDGLSGSAAAPFAVGLNDGPTVGLSLWVNPDGPTASMQIADSAQSGSFRGFRLTQLANGRVQFQVGNGAANILTPSVAAALLANGTWQHIGAIHDGALSSLYVNGQLVASVAATMVANTAAKFALGSVSAGTSSFWPGSIDEAALFSILTAADILNHYRAGRTRLLQALAFTAGPGRDGKFVATGR